MAKKLRAPAGTDEVNFGTESYRVGNDGTVEVPDEAVPTLKGVAGLTDADTSERVAPEGHALMKSTIGPMSFSFEGQSYATDENDIVEVPLAAFEHMGAHGLVAYTPETTQSDAESEQVPVSDPGDGSGGDPDAPEVPPPPPEPEPSAAS